MKKIGILTFHRAYNFGAVLQTYALQETLTNLSDDFDVNIIDYRNRRIENWFHAKSLKSKALVAIRFLLYHSYYKELKLKEQYFKEFSSNYLIKSEKCASLDDAKNNYDEIVVGSDQVWNYDMTLNDINYFLPYQDGARKLSYAASFGKSCFKDEQNKEIKKYLQAFEVVLVREGAGVRFAKSLGIVAKKVVDPTLLLNKEQWSRLCKPCNVKKPFILLYIVAKETYSISLAKKIAEEKGWNVIYLDPPRYQYEGVTRLKAVGPCQFLWLIKNAKLVVTTSYHGVLFSLNFNTPFLYELAHLEGNTNSRLEEIVGTYELDEYAIENDDVKLYENAVYNWNRLNTELKANRNQSMRILQETII